MACGSFEEGASSGGSDGGPDAGGEGAVTSGGCPSGKGPAMVRVDGKFCIDSTEVTHAQYKQFLDAMGGETGTQIPACAANGTFYPDDDKSWTLAPGRDLYPITYVDWCDAYAFCAWAGKRLCGRIGTGAPVVQEALTDPKIDEWFYACSEGGKRAFAYGATCDSNACNLELPDGSDRGLQEVKSFPGCEGGFPGIFDMSGNVHEWVNSCTSDEPSGSCRERSSGFYENQSLAGCAAARSHPRDYRFHIGIRCCATGEGP